MNDELANQPPSDWESVPIGERFQFTNKPKGLRFVDCETIPFVPMERIPSDRLFFSDFILKNPQEISSGTYFEEGDLLVSKITPCFENGKQGIVTKIPGSFGMATTEVIPIKAKEGVSHLPFLAMYLLDSEVRNSLAGKMEGATGRQRLAKSVLEDWVMPFPPLPEQRSIAAVLAKIQTAVEVQDKIVVTLKELKAATMAKLFREGIVKGLMFDSNVFDDLIDGKLDLDTLPKNIKIHVTHIQRNELAACKNSERRVRLQEVFLKVAETEIPTASAIVGISEIDGACIGDAQLFEELSGGHPNRAKDALIAETAMQEHLILVTNDNNLRARVEKLGGECISAKDLIEGKLRPTKQTEIGEIPWSWELQSIEDIGQLVTGTTPSTTKPEYYGGDVPFISPGDIGDGRVVRKTEKKLSPLGVDVSRPLPPRTVLVVCIGSTIGKVGMTAAPVSCTNQQINSIICGEEFIPECVYYVMVWNSDRVRTLSTPSPVPILSKGAFGKGIVVVPSDKHEQEEIARILCAIDDRIEKAEEMRDAIQALFSSMLHLLMTGQVRVTNKGVNQWNT